MTIKKTSGNTCTGNETGSILPVELVYEINGDDIAGYISLPGRPMGKISGKELSDLSLVYPYFYQYFEGGHRIKLSEGKVLRGVTRLLNSLVNIQSADGKSMNLLPERNKITGQLMEKPLDKNEKNCSIVLADMDLTPTEPESASEHFERMGGLYMADVLYTEGRKHYYKGDFIGAKIKNEKALAIREKILGPEDEVVSDSLDIVAGLYLEEGRFEEALSLYNRSLAIKEKIHGPMSVNITTNLFCIAIVNISLGQHEEAESLFIRGKEIYEQTIGTENIFYPPYLLGLAEVYFDLARYSDMEPLCNRALAILKKVTGPYDFHIAEALGILAKMFFITGQYEKAESRLKEALLIIEKATDKDHMEIANHLNSIASLYMSAKRFREAEPLFVRALAIREKAYGPEGLKNATILSNLAALYSETGRYSEAEKAGVRALGIRRKFHGPENKYVAYCLHNLAESYTRSGRYPEAEACFKEGLGIAQVSLDPYLLHNLQDGYSRLLALTSRPYSAIYFGKKAVNNIQGLRQNVSRLGEESLKSYSKTVESSYRHLSDLLIDAGRLHEAQQVMELLKQQEFFQFVRRNESAATSLGTVTFTAAEKRLDERYQDASVQLLNIFPERADLNQKSQRSPEEDQRLSSLDVRYKDAGTKFLACIEEIVSELGTSNKGKAEQISDDGGLARALVVPDDGSVVLYTLVGETRYRLVVVAPGFHRSYTSPVGEKVLNREIAKFREALSDPRKIAMRETIVLARKLYQSILAPAAEDLKGHNVKTLLWSLDGSLRYLPVAALHDGEGFIVEKFQNVVFTPALGARSEGGPRSNWEGLGLGMSKKYGEFPELLSVPGELSAVIRTDGRSSGIVPGIILLNESFTRQSMAAALEKGYPLVHIASHFKFTPGNDTMSYLLLGDGDRLTLSEINAQGNLLEGADLLTISACETAAGDAPNTTGTEVEGFAVIAQKKGARSVLATLWPVADESTGLFMLEFYRQRESTPGISKSEALRRAQVALLKGELKGGEKYTHPYYWGPFVLTGDPR